MLEPWIIEHIRKREEEERRRREQRPPLDMPREYPRPRREHDSDDDDDKQPTDRGVVIIDFRV